MDTIKPSLLITSVSDLNFHWRWQEFQKAKISLPIISQFLKIDLDEIYSVETSWPDEFYTCFTLSK